MFVLLVGRNMILMLHGTEQLMDTKQYIIIPGTSLSHRWSFFKVPFVHFYRSCVIILYSVFDCQHTTHNILLIYVLLKTFFWLLFHVIKQSIKFIYFWNNTQQLKIKIWSFDYENAGSFQITVSDNNVDKDIKEV